MLVTEAAYRRYWLTVIGKTADAVDVVMKQEHKKWPREMSVLVAAFAEDFILVQVPWLSATGRVVPFRWDANEQGRYVNPLDTEWKIYRILRYDFARNRELHHWKIEKIGTTPYYAVTKKGSTRPASFQKKEWEHPKKFPRIKYGCAVRIQEWKLSQAEYDSIN